MPDRTSPTIMRAQVVFQGASQLPEDRFINTFYFERLGGAGPIDATENTEANSIIANFYNVAGSSGNAVSKYLSNEIVKTALSAEVRVYDLGEAHPREPIVTGWTLATTADSTRLPTEVAVCGSFYADRNIPRQRGRLYIGPLNLSALDQSTGRPHSGIMNAIAEGMERITTLGTTLQWVAYSTVAVGGSWLPVDNGWVDNAFDIQRRRGIEASSRIVWP